MSKRKKIVYHGCYSKTATGFGKNAKNVLSYLHETDKYDIVEYANSPRTWSDQMCQSMPWKCYGALPDNEAEIKRLFNDQNNARAVQYGSYNIDKVIKQERPDLYLGVEDIWGFSGFWDKPWWNKFPCAIWTTLDSLPIIDIAKNNASKIQNYWVWTDFARKALHEMGHNHVKTVHGAIDSSIFKPCPEEQRQSIRATAGLDDDTIVFGFVFRNQLRKLVGTLLEAFLLFKKKNPNVKAKLLLHTFWDEPFGWKIQEFMEEFKVPQEDVLTTYICRNCRKIQVKPYAGQGLDCNVCGAQQSQVNPQVDFGCNDEDLNYIYNMMDAYAHPMTSGGLEIPIVEAMFAGLPVGTVPYSCGTEFTKNPDVFPFEYTEYREITSQFIKAQPSVESIAQYMSKMHKLGRAGRKRLGESLRKWAQKEFDINDTYKFLEDFIDNLPENNYDFNFEKEKRDEEYPLKEIENEVEWLKDLYSGCLKMEDEDENSDGLRHWVKVLENGGTRENVHKFFIDTARKENLESEKVNVEDFFEKTDKKKLAYVMPQSIGDCFISTAILQSLPSIYPLEEWDYYVCTLPENMEMFKHLPFIKNIIPYTMKMDEFSWWEGRGENKGLVDIAFQPYITTQRISSYNHNGEAIDALQEIVNGNLLYKNEK